MFSNLFKGSQFLKDQVEARSHVFVPNILTVSQERQRCLLGICLGPEISHNPINKLSEMEGQLPISSPPSLVPLGVCE